MPDFTNRVVIEGKASWQRPVLAIQNAPPGSPAKADRYLVGTAGSDAWVGHDNEIAIYDGTQWLFDVPSEGWFVWVLALDVLYQHTGVAWVEYPIHEHANKEILDLIEEALTTELKGQYDDAYAKAHEHANIVTLDAIEEALTTALKAQYDEAYNKRAKYDADLGVIYFEEL